MCRSRVQFSLYLSPLPSSCLLHFAFRILLFVRCFFGEPARSEERQRHRGVADHERPCGRQLQRRVGQASTDTSASGPSLTEPRRPRTTPAATVQRRSMTPTTAADEQHRGEEESLLEREGAVDPGVALQELADERLGERTGRRRRGRRRAGRSSPSARPTRRCRAAGRRPRPARARAASLGTPARRSSCRSTARSPCPRRSGSPRRSTRACRSGRSR